MAWRKFLSEWGGVSLPEKVMFLDTTLRDGEQTPGVALLPEEKLEIARQLDVLGVDMIEAGFPAASKGELEAIRIIASEGLSAEIVALARSERRDIELAASCGVDCIHTFIATSEIHLKKKLRLSREEVLSRAVEGVELVKEHGLKCEFSAEDATRSDLDFLVQVYRAVTDAGADRIDIPDTVGVAVPRSMYNIVRHVKRSVNVPIAVHCHDDMGLAVANSLAGVEAGAEEIHATINGLGERAGNASLEEAALALYALYGIKTSLNLGEIYRTSQLVSKLTGVRLPPNKAVVGDNAFAHESGIHAHGVLSSPETYEPLPPELVGHRRRIVAGKHAGRHGVDAILREMGLVLSPTQLDEVVYRVKELGDKGRNVTETDLLYIVETVAGKIKPEKRRIKLKDLIVVTGDKTTPTATIRLVIDGVEYKNSDFGIGPIDAVMKAFQGVMSNVANFRLVDFKLDAITGGSDALANVTVKLVDDMGRIVSGKGVREDIVMAGVEAVIDAANRLLNIRSTLQDARKTG
ncbi:MAG: 2-isopropylmalate synthase [Candidatus Bathyarchaeia archaeon]